MDATVRFHDAPITGKTKVTDAAENAQSRTLILKDKPSLFQYVYLLGKGDGPFGIFHIKRNVPPWSAGLATRSVVGFIAAIIRLSIGVTKLFERKSFACSRQVLKNVGVAEEVQPDCYMDAIDWYD